MYKRWGEGEQRFSARYCIVPRFMSGECKPKETKAKEDSKEGPHGAGRGEDGKEEGRAAAEKES